MTDRYRSAQREGTGRHARYREHFDALPLAELREAVLREEARLRRESCCLLAAHGKRPWSQGLEQARGWWKRAVRPRACGAASEFPALDRRLRERTVCPALGERVVYLGSKLQIALLRVLRESARWPLAARLGRAVIAAEDARLRVQRPSPVPQPAGDARWRRLGNDDALDFALDRHLTDIQPVRLPGLVGRNLVRYEGSGRV